MPTNSNGQFVYPQTDWATGKMRMAKADKLPDQPTLGEPEGARGSFDYSTLEETIGKQGSDYIRKWDGIVGHKNAPTDQQKAWEVIRKRMIDQMQREQTSPGPAEPTSGQRKNYPYSVRS